MPRERARRGVCVCVCVLTEPLPMLLLLCMAYPDEVTGMARGDASTPAPTTSSPEAGAGHQQTGRRARGRPRAAMGSKSAVGPTPVLQRCGFAEGCDAGARRLHFGVPGREQRFCREHRQTSHRNLKNFKARRLCRHPGCTRLGTFGANASALLVDRELGNGAASATNGTGAWDGFPALYCKKHSKPGERSGPRPRVQRAPRRFRILCESVLLPLAAPEFGTVSPGRLRRCVQPTVLVARLLAASPVRYQGDREWCAFVPRAPGAGGGAPRSCQRHVFDGKLQQGGDVWSCRCWPCRRQAPPLRTPQRCRRR